MHEGIIEVDADRTLLEDMHTPTHSPMNATVAHDNVCGAETGAELRGHSEQSHSRGPAGGVLTGSGAAATDKALHQTVQLLEGVQGTHHLGRDARRGISAGSRGWGENNARVFMSKGVHKKSRSADWKVGAHNVALTDRTPTAKNTVRFLVVTSGNIMSFTSFSRVFSTSADSREHPNCYQQ